MDRLLRVQLNCRFVLPPGILHVMYSYIWDHCASCVCSYMFHFSVNVLPLTLDWCQPHQRIHSPVNVVTLVSLCHQQNDHQVDWRKFCTHRAVNLQRSWNEQWLPFRVVLRVHRPVHRNAVVIWESYGKSELKGMSCMGFLYRYISKNIAYKTLTQYFFPGPKRNEIIGDWRKLHNEELQILFSYVLVYKKYAMSDKHPFGYGSVLWFFRCSFVRFRWRVDFA
jgi:hypothetical protein